MIKNKKNLALSRITKTVYYIRIITIIKKNIFLSKKEMQFIMNPELTGIFTDALDQFATGGSFNRHFRSIRNSSCCQEKNWYHVINLSHFPTKPEDLHVKMDKESETLSISGKSESTIEKPNGFKVFSTNIWSKDIKIPENVDVSTLDAKMRDNMLTITAEFKVDQNEETQIPIERLD